jgi:AraC family transcriptional regulator of adaptative response / DNA-3-methyladenine glycosylase II
VQHVGAVVTTGIYCRPGCGARPRAENVLRFASAPAAEAAGYRACLRCRPYRSPLSVPGTGSELACRAVRLILAGALDEGRETDLAARLSVSERHLRRLFTARLGVTPDGLARSARAHFARRLLDDTDLTITEIAYAAGFGSLRQFNRVCRQVFRAAPGELRARRRSTDRLVADGGLALRLPYQGRLDWDAMVGYFAARAVPGVEQVTGPTYRRTVLIRGNPGVLELLPGGDDHLILRAHLPHWEGLIHLVDRARRIANLDLDSTESVGRLATEALIGPLVAAEPGLRPPGTWDPFETGVRAIIGYRMSGPAANAVMGRLVERLGRPVAGLAQFGLHHTFPSPESVADADLSGLGIPVGRAAAVRSYARAVASDAIRLDRSVSLDRVVSTIVGIDGVGPQTAHYIALRAGEPDAWPVSGRLLERALAGRVWPPAASHRMVERWRPYRAVAATHIWRAAEAEPARAA